MCYKHASSCGVSAAALAKCLAVWGCWAIAELQATGAKGVILAEHFWYKDACWDATGRAKNKEDRVVACGKKGSIVLGQACVKSVSITMTALLSRWCSPAWKTRKKQRVPAFWGIVLLQDLGSVLQNCLSPILSCLAPYLVAALSWAQEPGCLEEHEVCFPRPAIAMNWKFPWATLGGCFHHPHPAVRLGSVCGWLTRAESEPGNRIADVMRLEQGFYLLLVNTASLTTSAASLFLSSPSPLPSGCYCWLLASSPSR